MERNLKELEKLARHRDYKIALANEIIDEMRWGLSAKQQKILDYMLAEILPEDTQDKRYSVSIKDYCKEFNIDYRKNSTNYQDIKAAVKTLNNQSRWIDIDKHESVLVQWFRNVKINYDRDTIEYNIDDTIAPYLFGLVKTGNYTTHGKREIGGFESKYSRPLYILLKRYLEVGITQPILPIGKLKIQLAAEKYDRYPDLRRFALDMAVKEINELTFMKVSYEGKPQAGSRKIGYVTFEIRWIKPYEDEYAEREWNNKTVYGERDLLIPI